MSLATAAKQGGGLSVLWPRGCTSVEDLPADLSMAISHAFLILSWHENLVKEEIPPRWMWAHDDELKYHWEKVEAKRKEKYGGNDSDQDLDSPDRMRNEYAERFGR